MPSKVRILDPPHQQNRPLTSTDEVRGRSSLGPAVSGAVRWFAGGCAEYVPRVPEARTVASTPATLTDVATQPHASCCVAELTSYEVKHAACGGAVVAESVLPVACPLGPVPLAARGAARRAWCSPDGAVAVGRGCGSRGCVPRVCRWQASSLRRPGDRPRRGGGVGCLKECGIQHRLG
jgi:hypothetical protein